MPVLLLLLCGAALLLLCNGCFLKSDKTGTADNIITELLYADDTSELLIAHEAVFHVTNKRSRGGVTNTSGYTHTRLSTYDVKTGQLLKRQVLGNDKDHPHLVFTLANGQLWVLSKDEEVQLQTYDPHTLKVTAGTDELLKLAPFLKGHLARPEWYELNRYFYYDALKGIVLTDDQGFHYTLDPATLHVDKIIEPGYVIPMVTARDKQISSRTGAYNDKVTLSMNGSPRTTIMYDFGKTVPNDPGYLEGSFLLDSNLERVKQLQAPRIQALYLQLQMQQQARDSVQALMDKLPAGSAAYRSYETDLRFRGYRIADTQRAIDAIAPHHTPGKPDPLLQVAPGRFFILQAASTSKDALLTLSQVEWQPGEPIQQRWQAPVTGMFFDPNNARETNNFKYVFSAGNPQFDFQWADLAGKGQRLLLTWMLHTTCIDVNSGKVLWQIRH